MPESAGGQQPGVPDPSSSPALSPTQPRRKASLLERRPGTQPSRGKPERERAGKWSLLLFREIRGVHQGPHGKQMAPQIRSFEEIEIKGHLRSCGQGKGDDQGWHCSGGEGPITLQVRKAKVKAGTWSGVAGSQQHLRERAKRSGP